MNKCLITKLNRIVDNNSLFKIGEMSIKISRVSSPNVKTQSFNFKFSKETKLEIIGDGYFTDASLSPNKGKTLVIPAGSKTDVYVSNGDFELRILNKYNLRTISFVAEGQIYQKDDVANKTMDIGSLAYSTLINEIRLTNTNVYGDIAALKRLSEVILVELSYTKVYGDIANVKECNLISTLRFSNTQVSGDIQALQNLTELVTFTISNTQVSGNIAAMSGLTKLTSYDVTNTSVWGDISSIQNLSKLTSVNFMYTGVTGSVSSLKNLTLLRDCYLYAGSFSGDLALLPASCSYISFRYDKGSNLTWSSRSSSSVILSIDGTAKLDNVDKMLQDQANCQVPNSTVQKVISVVGTRTSASDAAVASLQQKGYTVSITPAQ